MVGKFILEKLDNLPTFSQSRDWGRLVLDKSTDRVYYGQENGWLNTNDPDIHDYSYHSDIDQALLTTSDVQFNTINGLDINQIGSGLDDHIGSGGDAHSTATTSIDGFMSSSDKSKLNNIDANANNYTLETHNRNYHSDIDQALLTTSNVQFNRIDVNEYMGATTASRTNSSTTTLLQAKGMNDHRTSGDHDSRYYTKTESDNNFNNYSLETHDRSHHTDINQALLTSSNVNFNRVTIDGSSYGANAKNVTISTSGPSGGQNGDVWIEIEE